MATYGATPRVATAIEIAVPREEEEEREMLLREARYALDKEAHLSDFSRRLACVLPLLCAFALVVFMLDGDRPPGWGPPPRPDNGTDATPAPSAVPLAALASSDPAEAARSAWSTERRPLVVGATVRCPSNGSKMPLTARVDVDFGAFNADWCHYAVEYAPRGGTGLPPLWSPRASSASTDLFRLRAAATYDYRIHARCGDVVDDGTAGSFATAATGFARVDGRPYADVAGDPGWAVGSFAAYPGFASPLGDKFFEGLLAIDAEGYVVFMYSSCALEAWDRWPNGDIVALARSGGGCENGAAPAGFADAGGSANSRLNAIGPDGELRAQYVAACGDSPMNFNMVSHEAAILADGRVVTAAYEARGVANITATVVLPDVSTDLEVPVTKTFDAVVASKVAVWDPSAASGAPLEVLYDLSDLAWPAADSALEGDFWNTAHMECGGSFAKSALEYHHVSSISVSASSGDLVVASRNLNAVWSLRSDGSGVSWTLGGAGSDYAFERDLDAFYQPHSASQLADGRVLLVDDGNGRPGCGAVLTGACFSRAVEYDLGADGVARIAWQFAYPKQIPADPDALVAVEELDLYNPVGGSVARDGDSTLVAFTSLMPTHGEALVGGLAFEVDAAGGVTSTTTLPAEDGSEGKQNAYRFVAWPSLFGESDASPLGAADDALDVTDESRLIDAGADGGADGPAPAGEWRLYKHAAAVGRGSAAAFSEIADRVLGPADDLLSLGCDGVKASVDLLPHGPQLHWVDGGAAASDGASVDEWTALLAADRRGMETFTTTMHDKVQVFAPDLAGPLAALDAAGVPVMRRRLAAEGTAHASFDLGGVIYELVGPAAGDAAAWPEWAEDECPESHALLGDAAALLAAYDAGVADASDAVAAWAADRGFFPPMLAGVTLAVADEADAAEALGDLGAIAGLDAAWAADGRCAVGTVALRTSNSEAAVALRFVANGRDDAVRPFARGVADAALPTLAAAENGAGWSHWLDRHLGLKFVPDDDDGADACAVADALNGRFAATHRALGVRSAYDFGGTGELHWYAAYGGLTTALEYHVAGCPGASSDGGAQVCMCVASNNDVDYAAANGGASCYDPPANAGTTNPSG